ncbi:MAG: PQQ-dependent sugar dehydrogenase [Methanobacteriota archaeon]
MHAAVRALGIVAILLTVVTFGSTRGAAQGGEAILETYMSDLRWPVAFAFSADGRIFFAERFTGQIRIVEGGVLLDTPFYTLEHTAVAEEQGLLGLALDPAFPAVPWVYAYQTYQDPADGFVYNRILRIRAEGNLGTTSESLLSPIPAARYHNGGVIAFGPDGNLYAVVGDNAVPANAQDLLSLAGKVLRMRSDGTVPADNPFVGNGSANPFVYTYGHRNMFGLAFHPVTGRAYVTENGPECNDEVNLLLPGRGYGWGANRTCSSPPPPPLNTNQEGPDPVMPLAWYGTVIAPTNAIVYEGAVFPAWEGDVIFAEWLTRDLRRLDLGPAAYDTVLSEGVVLTAPERVADVELGPDGAIWLSTSASILRYAVPSVDENPTVAWLAFLLWPGGVIAAAAGVAAFGFLRWRTVRRKAGRGPDPGPGSP